jgi:putative ABC transport system permease protein
MFEDFINTLQTFKQNRIRTFLSLLGVIIGVASVIIITTLGQSATANIQGTFGSSGLDLVNVSAGYMRRSRSVSVQLNESFRQEIFDAIPYIRDIYYKNNNGVTLRHGTTDVNVSAEAIEYNYLEMSNIELDYGEYFNVSDIVHGAQKIIIGPEVAQMLFPEGDPLGKVITLDSGRILFGFEVIGVMKEQNAALENVNGGAFIPRGFYSKKIDPDANANTMVIRVVNQDRASEVATLIETYVYEKTGIEYSISVTSMQSILDQFNEVMGTVSLLLSGVAAISLLVGGIGIMNIMIVTVTERRKEIGMRKALGATPGAIRMQFLVESATITLIGGSLGIVAGLALSFVIVFIAAWSFSIQWTACLIAFGFSAFVGVFFGLSPASRAAKLDPVEALSSE